MYACVRGDNPRALGSGLIIAFTGAKAYNTSFVYYEIFIVYKNGSRVILCPNIFFSVCDIFLPSELSFLSALRTNSAIRQLRNQ